MSAYYPVFLDLTGRPVLVVGGGPVAEGKVEGVLAGGANVTVVSPTVTPRLAGWIAVGRIEHLARVYQPGDLAGLRDSVHPIETVVFPGKLDRHALGLAEKAIVSVVHAPDGDFRTWEPVSAWAARIARTLETTLAEDAL